MQTLDKPHKTPPVGVHESPAGDARTSLAASFAQFVETAERLSPGCTRPSAAYAADLLAASRVAALVDPEDGYEPGTWIEQDQHREWDRTETGEEIASGCEGEGEADQPAPPRHASRRVAYSPPFGSARLSTLHISDLTIARGGTLAKLRIPGAQPEHLKYSKRSKCAEYTEASQRRLSHLLASIDQERCPASMVWFVTCTYQGDLRPTARQTKKDLNRFGERLLRRFPRAAMVWKLEPHASGVPHYHGILLLGEVVEQADLREWFADAWVGSVRDYRTGKARPLDADTAGKMRWFNLRENTKNGSIEPMRSWNGVMKYASKYVGKCFVLPCGWVDPGRFWGVIGRANLPILRESVEMSASVTIVARRLLRRFLERQPARTWYVPGSGKMPGQKLIDPTPETLALARSLGFEPRQQHRKARNRGRRKIKLFIPADNTLNVSTPARVETLTTPPAKRGGLIGCSVYLNSRDAKRLYSLANFICGGTSSKLFRDVREPEFVDAPF